MALSAPTVLLIFFIYFLFLILSHAIPDVNLKGVDLGKPVLDVPLVLPHGIPVTSGLKDTLLCERVRVSGLSRLKLGSYSSSILVTLVPSVKIPERLHSKIQVCFHRNSSLGWCDCEKDEWRTIQKGVWSSVMSPYEEKYVDVRFTNDVAGPVTIAIEEDIQQWRLICLALGFILLLLAPIVSSWVPFYYSSSMAIGIFLVIIILLFQGMKLLPTGRKNIFYLTVYGSVLGAGSFLLHHFSMLVNSILQSFGLSEEMHNPVSVFLLVGIVLAGAALGYWIVRKYVISKDGSVDAGVAQFVKWAMRIVGITSILQSTIDTLLAIGALILCWTICKLINSSGWRRVLQNTSGSVTPLRQRAGQTAGRCVHAEFLSKSNPRRKLWNSGSDHYTLSNSPIKGVVSPSSGAWVQQDYYSTFHKTSSRKRFTKKEWEDFTQESTRQALAEWASSPEFTDWVIEHADRIQVLPSESSDETGGSESDSTDDVGSGNRFQFIRG